MKLRIFILFLFLPLLRAQASVIDSLMTQPRDSIGLTSDSLVLHFLEESGIPISDNNKVKLLKSGREKFIDLFEAIRQAKHTCIWNISTSETTLSPTPYSPFSPKK